MLQRREMPAPLHEIHLNSLENPVATKPLYNNKRDSHHIMGNIFDSYDDNKTDNPYNE
jgi:hypothetical protein